MKTIINGVRYDTEKAIALGDMRGGSDFVTDFTHWSGTLYRTPRSGRYFLAGSGGPMSMFAERTQSGWRGSERIIPMDEDEAFELAQRVWPAELVEQHFGHLIEDA